MSKPPGSSTIQETANKDGQVGQGTMPGEAFETCLKTLDAIEPPPPPPHPRLGEFLLTDKLGKGGMGIVYKSYHPRLQKTVAIKILKDAVDLSIDDLNRFRGEALLAATLQHANIVQIFDILQETGTPFIVMEYVDGGSLEQKLAGKPQPPRDAVEWVEKIARAVAYAHDHQIIHRDLKPANILITTEGVLKITDFGLGKRLNGAHNETRSGMIIGTPHYMAPEQAAGNTQLIGPAADIHALGAILYEMLTGRPPFQGVNLVEILEQVINAEPPAPSRLVARIPKELSTICLKCLSKSPSRRYASATALADDLHRWQAGESIVARPTGRIERMSRIVYKHPLRTAFAVSAGMLVLVAGLLFFAERDRRVKDYEAAENQKNAEYTARLYQSTRGALESVLKHVSDDARLRSAPGIRELQRVMRDHYEQLVDLLEKDPRNTNRISLATAYDRLGKLYKSDDKPETSIKRYEKSSSIYQDLLPEEKTPENLTQVGLGLGQSLTEQGNLLYDLGRLEEAEARFGDALSRLNAADEQVVSLAGAAQQKTIGDEIQKSIAEVHHQKGILLQSQGNRPESLNEFKKALAIRTRLVAGNKGTVGFERDLARSYGYQGDVELEMGLNAEAESSYWKSFELRKGLYKPESMNPDDIEAAFQYVRSLQNFGNYHVRMRNFATARHYFLQTEEKQQEVLKREPENLDYKLDLASTQIRLAEMGLLQGSSKEEGLKQLELAQNLLTDLMQRNSANVSLNANLAECHLLQGILNFDTPGSRLAAIASLSDATKYLAMPLQNRAEANYKYLAASIGALIGEDKDRPLRENSLWLLQLKSALELGYGRKDLRDVENDRAFRKFKDRPEFRKLLKLEPIVAAPTKTS